MKISKIMGACLAIATLGMALVITSPADNAQAKTKSSLKTTPKKLRGTWYAYNSKNKKSLYDTVKVSAKKLKTTTGGTSWAYNLHVLNLKKNPSIKVLESEKMGLWGCAYNKGKWTYFQNWADYRKNFIGTHERFQVKRQTLNGKSVKTLHSINYNSDKDPIYSSYYYHTKAQAKAANPKGITQVNINK